MYWLYYFFYLFLLFFPGYSLVDYLIKINKIDISKESKIILAPIASITLLFAQGLLYLWSKNELFLQLSLVTSFLGLIYFIYRRLFLDSKLFLKYFVIGLLTLSIINISIYRRDQYYGVPSTGYLLDSSTPVPVTGYTGYFADSINPWRIARYYYNQKYGDQTNYFDRLDDLLIGERTPLLPIITSSIISIFGESHFVYARFLEVLALLYYLGLFYLVTTQVSSRVKACLLIVMILGNVQLSQLSFNTEIFYKYFAAYPIIIAIPLLFDKVKRNNSILASFLMVVSFLIHPYTVILSASLLIVYSLRKWSSFGSFFRSLLWFTPLLVSFIVWLLFSTAAPPTSNQNQRESVYFQEYPKETQSFFSAKSINLLQLVYPNPLKKSVDPQNTLTPYELKYQFIRFSLISNLSPIIFLSIVFLIKKTNKRHTKWLILGISPLIIFWLLYLNRYNQLFDYGGAYFLLYHFSIPILLIYVVEIIKPKLLLLSAVCGYFLWMSTIIQIIGDPYTNPAQQGTVVSTLSFIELYVFYFLIVAGIVCSSIYHPEKLLPNRKISI